MLVQKHMSILGLEAKDKVTGFKGVVTSVAFDLYGCIQVVLTPKVDDKGDHKDGRWLDIGRLKVTGKKPVMDLPNFDYGEIAEGKKGPAEKPPIC